VIEPVETLLAVVGVRPFIYRTVPTITKEHVAEAANFGTSVPKLAKQLCAGGLSGRGISELPYDKTLAVLYDEFTPEDMGDIQKAFAKNASDLEPAVLAKVGEIVNFLRGIFPRKSFDTLAGPEQITPDEYELCTFAAVLDALDDPLSVFDGMSNASLLLSQVAAVRQFYPTIAAAIDDAVNEAPKDARVARASFRLDWNTEIGINKWLGNPPVDPELAAMVMEVQQASSMNQPAPPPPNPKAHPEEQLKGALSDASRASMPVSQAVK
jgi:hypothetical protein